MQQKVFTAKPMKYNKNYDKSVNAFQTHEKPLYPL